MGCGARGAATPRNRTLLGSERLANKRTGRTLDTAPNWSSAMRMVCGALAARSPGRPYGAFHRCGCRPSRWAGWRTNRRPIQRSGEFMTHLQTGRSHHHRTPPSMTGFDRGWTASGLRRGPPQSRQRMCQVHQKLFARFGRCRRLSAELDEAMRGVEGPSCGNVCSA